MEQYERAEECYQNRQSSTRPDKGTQTQQPCGQATQGCLHLLQTSGILYSLHISLF